jgi:cold shock CspA family protein
VNAGNPSTKSVEGTLEKAGETAPQPGMRTNKGTKMRIRIMEATQHEGIITLYNHAKAWGFITESSGEAWFFHFSNCWPEYLPTLGDAVEFKIAPPISLGKKDQAIDVRLVGSSTSGLPDWMDSPQMAEMFAKKEGDGGAQ